MLGTWGRRCAPWAVVMIYSKIYMVVSDAFSCLVKTTKNEISKFFVVLTNKILVKYKCTWDNQFIFAVYRLATNRSLICKKKARFRNRGMGDICHLKGFWNVIDYSGAKTIIKIIWPLPWNVILVVPAKILYMIVIYKIAFRLQN